MIKKSYGTTVPLLIGELLVKEGYLKREDIDAALKIQQKEAEAAKLPMGEILIRKKLISPEDLQMLLGHPDLRKDIEILALEKGLINQKQMEEARLARRKTEQTGNTLVRLGSISRDDLDSLIEQERGGIQLGDLARKLNMISDTELKETLTGKKFQRTIGEIVCDMGLISPIDLGRALKKYRKELKIGEIFLKQGVIDEGQYQEAIQEQIHSTDPLGQIMIDKGFISQEQLCAALSRQYNIPFKKFVGFQFSEKSKKELIKTVGLKFAEKNLILPLGLKDQRIKLAVTNPAEILDNQDLLPLFSRFKVDLVLVTEENFYNLFRMLYGKSIKNFRVADEKKSLQEDVDLVDIDLQQEDINDGKTNLYGVSDMEAKQVVDYIIKFGIINNASDIHIEQDRSGARLRYRLDGVLHNAQPEWLDKKVQEVIGAIISRIKIMSDLDIAERRLPQDGVFRINYLDRTSRQRFDLDFRVATCPAIVGENVTIRILDSRKARVGLDKLNHSLHIIDPVKRFLKSAAGMVLVSGPTGSGKSSTLYGALQYVYNPGIKIITAEDPIEYNFPGIMQTQIKPKINLTFARLLRSFLRLDPDVIFIGEIRDEETARIAFDAAQTGHLLLSTIHTNDAVSSITRLLDLNIEQNQIASGLMGVLAQRLVRRVCDVCVREYRPVEEEWSILFDTYPEHLTFYKGIGCKACNFTGYRGRTLISELLEITREIARALSKGATENEIKRLALNAGMRTMIDDGLLKMGQTTLPEIIRVVPIELIKEFKSRTAGQQEAVLPEEQPGLDGTAEVIKMDTAVVISDPVADAPAIDRLYEDYESLNKAVTPSPDRSDPAFFKAFIAKIYQKICTRFNCRQVNFSLRPGTGRVDILAGPALPVRTESFRPNGNR
ncbi:MAG: Flp pilus assembly complex ATPase component TadA [Deltaproteobacteria bacterium]|nr:Flp pilus assembly complex ATPase component TadA [Deltaproteobacteria bacterium]